MSMNKHTCLLLGIRIPKNLMDDSLFHKWYEFEENPDKNTNLSLVWGESSEYYYLGEVLASSEPYSYAENVEVDFGAIDVRVVRDSIYKDFNINMSITDIRLYFFDYWR